MSTGIEDLLAAPLGLRERKKLKTRRAIRAAAFRLFSQQGFEATTVDQIAAAADVSPSTFFRYFPVKEDLVVTDDYDPVMEAALRSRPLDESLMESVRQTVLPALRQIVGLERDDMLLRMRLLRGNPVLRARGVAEMQRTRDLILTAFRDRDVRPSGELERRALVAAFLAAAGEAVEYWAERDGRDDLVELVERALDTIAAGAAGVAG
jgi:AcrR family transcriptional regulator